MLQKINFEEDFVSKKKENYYFELLKKFDDVLGFIWLLRDGIEAVAEAVAPVEPETEAVAGLGADNRVREGVEFRVPASIIFPFCFNNAFCFLCWFRLIPAHKMKWNYYLLLFVWEKFTWILFVVKRE